MQSHVYVHISTVVVNDNEVLVDVHDDDNDVDDDGDDDVPHSESLRVADCLVTGMQETLVFHATDGVGTATGSITVDISETVRKNCIY